MSTDTKENHLHESFVSTFVNKAPLLCCRPRPLLLLYLGDWSTCAVGPAHCCYCTLAIGRRGTIAYAIWLRSQYYWWSHVLLICPKYQSGREILKDKLNNIGIRNITIKTLLGGLDTKDSSVKNFITREVGFFIEK